VAAVSKGLVYALYTNATQADDAAVRHPTGNFRNGYGSKNLLTAQDVFGLLQHQRGEHAV
jgi:hypothetical protein